MCCVCNGSCNHVGQHYFCTAHGGTVTVPLGQFATWSSTAVGNVRPYPGRSYVSLDPRIMGGAPCLNHTRLTVRALVSYIDRGLVDEVYQAFPLATTEDVQIACWYEARHGKKRRRKAWAAWADEYEERSMPAGYPPATRPDGCDR